MQENPDYASLRSEIESLREMFLYQNKTKFRSPHPGSSPTTQELDTALAKAQADIQVAHKDSKNPFYHSTYADLASCWDACRKALSDNGLSVCQFTEPVTERFKIRIVTRLAHSSGQWISGVLELRTMAREKGEGWVDSDDPQSIGTSITYGRRYALCAMVGIAPEDTDAEKGKQEFSEALKKATAKPSQSAASFSQKTSGLTVPPDDPNPDVQSPAPASSGAAISPANLKKLTAKLEAAELTSDDRDGLFAQFGIGKLEDLPKGEFINFIRAVDNPV